MVAAVAKAPFGIRPCAVVGCSRRSTFGASRNAESGSTCRAELCAAAPAGVQTDSMEKAASLGGVLASEKACDLKINQKAVESTCRSAPGCAC